MSNLVLNTSLCTAAFYSDSAEYPTTAYGEDIPVVVKCHSLSTEIKDSQITVKIGDCLFTLPDLQFLMDNIEKYKKSIELFNKNT
jgi:hypothetical protein